eukprot:scaffold88769_cov39-Phaeocystis_antarctica.AAC.1
MQHRPVARTRIGGTATAVLRLAAATWAFHRRFDPWVPSTPFGEPLAQKDGPSRSRRIATRFRAPRPFSDIIARCSLPNPPSSRRGRPVPTF